LALSNSGWPSKVSRFDASVPATVSSGISSAGRNSRLPSRVDSARFSPAELSA